MQLNDDDKFESSMEERELLVDRVNREDMPILGTPFLKSIVLTVNWNKNTFTMAKAIINSQSEVEPILLAGDTCQGIGDAVDEEETPVDTGSPSSSEPPNDTAVDGMSKSVIVGITVGSISGVCLLVAGAILVFRRVMKNMRKELTAAVEAAQRGDSDTRIEPKPDPVELPSGTIRPRGQGL